MAKENTHLFFAHRVLEDLENRHLLGELSRHMGFYYLGSIIPDTFYYSADESARMVSETLHGKTGNLTNEFIFQVLDNAQGMQDIAFIMGYITHCALDITLHPAVYYFSGNYYDHDQDARDHAVYMHRHIETWLDAYLENPLRIYALIRPKLMHALSAEKILSERFAVPPARIQQILYKQLFSNLVFTSTAAYRIAKLLAFIGIMKDSKTLGLFYGDVRTRHTCSSQQRAYRDIITGETRNASVRELMSAAAEKAKVMMEAAFDFHLGKIDRKDLCRLIPGESLDTGKIGATTDMIRYTSPNSTD